MLTSKMKNFLAPIFISMVLIAGLSSCHKENKPLGQSSDLKTKVSFVANGSYDSSADKREKIKASLRQVTWISKVPLPAQSVIVRYDGTSRAQSWELVLAKPSLSIKDLLSKTFVVSQTTEGKATHLTSKDRFADVVILESADKLRIITRGYATQLEPVLLSAFK